MTAVRVDLRQATLTESARVSESGDRVFLSIDNPPPVRSLLRLTIDGEQRAFEVGQVVEVVSDEQGERGCFGSFVDLARLEEQLQVGSEHLQPGISSGGVPSPVVIMNTNEMMLGEVGSDEGEAAAAGDAGGDAGGDDESEASSDGNAADGDRDDAAEASSDGDAADGDGDDAGEAASDDAAETTSDDAEAAPERSDDT